MFATFTDWEFEDMDGAPGYCSRHVAYDASSWCY